MFSAELNHAFQSWNLRSEIWVWWMSGKCHLLEFHSADNYVWWRGIMFWGCFSGFELGLLVPVKGC